MYALIRKYKDLDNHNLNGQLTCLERLEERSLVIKFYDDVEKFENYSLINFCPVKQKSFGLKNFRKERLIKSNFENTLLNFQTFFLTQYLALHYTNSTVDYGINLLKTFFKPKSLQRIAKYYRKRFIRMEKEEDQTLNYFARFHYNFINKNIKPLFNIYHIKNSLIKNIIKKFYIRFFNNIFWQLINKPFKKRIEGAIKYSKFFNKRIMLLTKKQTSILHKFKMFYKNLMTPPITDLNNIFWPFYWTYKHLKSYFLEENIEQTQSLYVCLKGFLFKKKKFGKIFTVIGFSQKLFAFKNLLIDNTFKKNFRFPPRKIIFNKKVYRKFNRKINYLQTIFKRFQKPRKIIKDLTLPETPEINYFKGYFFKKRRRLGFKKILLFKTKDKDAAKDDEDKKPYKIILGLKRCLISLPTDKFRINKILLQKKKDFIYVARSKKFSWLKKECC